MRYVNPHFGCPHEICYMKPKLMKDFIDWAYRGYPIEERDKFNTDSSELENSSLKAVSNKPMIQIDGEIIENVEPNESIPDLEAVDIEEPINDDKENTPPDENFADLQMNETDNDVSSSIFSKSTNKVILQGKNTTSSTSFKLPESNPSSSRIKPLESSAVQSQSETQFQRLQPEMQAEVQSDSATSATGYSGGMIADVSSNADISDISKLSLESSSTLPQCHCGIKTKIDPDTNKKRFYFYRAGKVLHFYQQYPSLTYDFHTKLSQLWYYDSTCVIVNRHIVSKSHKIKPPCSHVFVLTLLVNDAILRNL